MIGKLLLCLLRKRVVLWIREIAEHELPRSCADCIETLIEQLLSRRDPCGR